MVWTQASPEGLALTRAKPIWIAMTVKHAASVILQGKGCPLVVVLCIANCKLRKHKNNIKTPINNNIITTITIIIPQPQTLGSFWLPNMWRHWFESWDTYPHAGQQKNYLYMFISFHPAEPYATLLYRWSSNTEKSTHIKYKCTNMSIQFFGGLFAFSL